MKYPIGSGVGSNKEFRFEAGPYSHFYRKLPIMTVVAHLDDGKYRCVYNIGNHIEIVVFDENELYGLYYDSYRGGWYR
jgi:uncharacterized protein YodC (DUF2158 family)